MNILHIRASNFYGGPERQLHRHCLKAAGTEFNISVGSFSEGGGTPEFLTVIGSDNIPTCTFAVSSAYDRTAIGQVRNYLGEHETDLLCTHDYRSHFIGWLASRRTSVNWLAFSRGWTSENFKTRAFHALDKLIVRFADHIIAVSDAQRDRLIKLLIPGSRITTVHNAVDPAVFDDVAPVDLRDRFGLPRDAIIGICGGRLSAEKGQMDLVEAGRITVGENDRLVVIVFGNGPDLEAVRRRIDSYNLAARIIAPGFENNFVGCLKGADFLINPSHSEGLPNVVLEAMAMRVPCVATDVGGVGELIESDHSGLLVPAKSPQLLAAAIAKIAGNDYICSKYADNAYNTVIDRFSFDRQFDDLAGLYKRYSRQGDVLSTT